MGENSMTLSQVLAADDAWGVGKIQRGMRLALRAVRSENRPTFAARRDTRARRFVVGHSLPFLRAALVGTALVLSSNWVSAQQDPSQSGETAAKSADVQDNLSRDVRTIFEKDQVDLAVDKAIRYLVSQQRPDGAITDRRYDTTMTALAIMAMASVGVQPADPTPDGKAMGRALAFVLKDKHQDDTGYFGRSDGSRMYGHGITTLMLTELLGMGIDDTQDQQIQQRCQKAIDLILSAQKRTKSYRYQGGWRYTPTSADADLSVSVWQLMALRSAKNDGLQVPAGAIQQAVEYLQRSYVSTLDRNGMPDKRASGFSYTPGQTRATFAMTAAGLLAMQVCGQYESPLVTGSAEWLRQHPPKWNERFFFYGIYYYAQGMYQRGGDFARSARTLVQDMLLEKQRGDGSWKAQNSTEANVGGVYCTSLAVLSLSVKYHFLPIYQK